MANLMSRETGELGSSPSPEIVDWRCVGVFGFEEEEGSPIVFSFFLFSLLELEVGLSDWSYNSCRSYWYCTVQYYAGCVVFGTVFLGKLPVLCN